MQIISRHKNPQLASDSSVPSLGRVSGQSTPQSAIDSRSGPTSLIGSADNSRRSSVTTDPNDMIRTHLEEWADPNPSSRTPSFRETAAGLALPSAAATAAAPIVKEKPKLKSMHAPPTEGVSAPLRPSSFSTPSSRLALPAKISTLALGTPKQFTTGAPTPPQTARPAMAPLPTIRVVGSSATKAASNELAPLDASPASAVSSQMQTMSLLSASTPTGKVPDLDSECKPGASTERTSQLTPKQEGPARNPNLATPRSATPSTPAQKMISSVSCPEGWKTASPVSPANTSMPLFKPAGVSALPNAGDTRATSHFSYGASNTVNTFRPIPDDAKESDLFEAESAVLPTSWGDFDLKGPGELHRQGSHFQPLPPKQFLASNGRAGTTFVTRQAAPPSRFGNKRPHFRRSGATSEARNSVWSSKLASNRLIPPLNTPRQNSSNLAAGISSGWSRDKLASNATHRPALATNQQPPAARPEPTSAGQQRLATNARLTLATNDSLATNDNPDWPFSFPTDIAATGAVPMSPSSRRPTSPVSPGYTLPHVSNPRQLESQHHALEPQAPSSVTHMEEVEQSHSTRPALEEPMPYFVQVKYPGGKVATIRIDIDEDPREIQGRLNSKGKFQLATNIRHACEAVFEALTDNLDE